MSTDMAVAERRAMVTDGPWEPAMVSRFAVDAADTERLAAAMRTQYRAARVLPDGSVAVLVDLLFTRAIGLAVNWECIGRRFCFEDRGLADRRFAELQTEDDVPEGFIARRGS